MGQAEKLKGGKNPPPRKKPTNADKHIARPLTPEALAAYGELPPLAERTLFNPEGPWRQTWRIWMTGGAWDNYRGYLTIKRRKEAEGTFDLKVLQVLQADRTRAIHEMNASLEKPHFENPFGFCRSQRAVLQTRKRRFPFGCLQVLPRWPMGLGLCPVVERC